MDADTVSNPTNPSPSHTAVVNRNHWIPDSHCQQCFECGKKFSTFTRRHHCRFCGRIFCHRCSSHFRDGSSIGCPGPHRACGFCAANHEMMSTRNCKLMGTSQASAQQHPESPSLEFSANLQKPLNEPSGQLFPLIRSELESSSEFFSSDGDFRTWQIHRGRQHSQIFNLFPVVDDIFPTPRRLVSSTSVDGRQAFPDIQTFVVLWFKMTCPQKVESANVEPRPGLSFLVRNIAFAKQSFSGDAQKRIAPLPFNQKPFSLPTVMVGSDRCASGRDIVDWLVSSTGGGLESREKACALCEAYVRASFLKPLDSKSPVKFIDSSLLYRIIGEVDESPRLPRRTQSFDTGGSVLFNKSITFSQIPDEPHCEQLKSSSSAATFMSVPKGLRQVQFDNNLQPPEGSIRSQRFFVEPVTVYAHYLTKLIKQETRDHYLPSEWNELLFTAVNMVCDDMKLDLRRILHKNLAQRHTGSLSFNPNQQCSLIENMVLQEFFRFKYSPMSVLRYVHIKKVVSESNSCQILNGVAFTAHLIHKDLPTQLYLPRILIIASSVTYERNTYKRTWLDSYTAQEEEYLANCVMKIISFRPTVFLTEGGIANIALTMLVKSGIAIFCNVKRPVLARLAAATGAEVIESIDDFLSGSCDISKHRTSPVGVCKWYKLITLPQANDSKKSVCVFSFTDIPALSKLSPVSWLHIPDLNLVTNNVDEGLNGEERSSPYTMPICMPIYSVLMHGPDMAALKLAKRCFKLALLSCFNARFEIAYLGDAQILLTGDPSSSTYSGDCTVEESICSSSLALHLHGRLFNLSPLAITKVPFLASTEGRRIPLFDFYFYLVNWPNKRRLNDALKQKALVMRANIYADRKPLSSSSLPLLHQPSKQLPLCGGEEGRNKPRFLRRWTGMGRIIVTNDELDKGALKAFPSSKSIVKPSTKRLTRSIRDARSHTLTHVLRSVFSPVSATCPDSCLPSWIIGIDVYGPNDLPLGAFLEYFCFRSQSCLNPECNTPMLDHVQRFTQTAGSVNLTLQTIEPIHLSNPTDVAMPIVMWTHCRTCGLTSRPHAMSLLTWHFSFMKFIDFLINSPSCLTHKGSSNRVGYCSAKALSHCFSLDKIQATFCYYPIVNFEVCMPPIAVWVFHPMSNPSLAASYANSIIKQSSSKSMKKLNSVVEPTEMPDIFIVDVHATLKKYHELTMCVKSHLMNLMNETQCEELVRLLEAFEVTLNFECNETGIKSRVEVLSFLFDNLSKPRSSVSSDAAKVSTENSPDIDRPTSPTGYQLAWKKRLLTLSYEEKITLVSGLMFLIKRWLFNFINDWNSHISQYNSTVKMVGRGQARQRKLRTHQISSDTLGDMGSGKSLTGDLPLEGSPSSSNFDLALDNTEIPSTSGVLRRGEAGEGAPNSSHTLLEFLPESKAATITVEAMKRIWTAILPGGGGYKIYPDPWPPTEHPQIPPPNCRSPLLRALALQIPIHSSHVTPSETPDLTQRQCATDKFIEKLCGISILRATPDVYIFDQEITSIIAYALASENYSLKLQSIIKFQTANKASTRPESQFTDTEEKSRSGRSNSTNSIEGEFSVRHAEATPDKPKSEADVNANAPDEFKLSKTFVAAPIDPHIEIQFVDASTTFLCRIYYAEEFHQLRKLVLPQGEMSFIRSLSRCRNWDAQGGKSGSFFMKTLDERFVVKEVSNNEMKTFHDVRRQYFDYLMSAVSLQRLSLLARIFGIFHIDCKNSITGEARRLDVLVMENLFHNRPGITQIYDLKGSLRGRLVTNAEITAIVAAASSLDNTVPASSCGKAATTAFTANTDILSRGDASTSNRVPVLLDQNFINESLANPIYLRSHSKNALMHCLNLDTQFLADLFIMDYSLLVGIDRTTNQLVVGIIDYLRRFTLNKRLEMFVKQTLTSAQGPMPTVIMPVDYRERLLDQMDRNFHLVPDQWYGSLADHREVWRL